MKLSVVMPVRDVAPFIDKAVESILAQSYPDFEFVIRDDGSVDGTRDILRRWRDADPRIRLFEGKESLGPSGSANWVVAQARGTIVARMDGDDIAHPDRLKLQMDALALHPEACLVASLWEGIDDRGRRVRPRDRWPLVNPGPFAPFPHGSIMFRREAFDMVGGYRKKAEFWEDLDLYRRLAATGSLMVLPAALYQHRASVLSTRLTSDRNQVEAAVDRMYRTVTGAPAPAPGGRHLPRVFVSLGSTRLWAGHRTRSLRRLLSRGALRWDRESAAILVWALWGAASPKSLRFVLTRLIGMRDRVAGRTIGDEAAYRWSIPPGAHGDEDEAEDVPERLNEAA
ncbi:MAG TPA: glycosyltransferase family A protein [Allosphingosinicella sp.]|nr:glycosyltransferase family A protein [Allosphingosinicella sp.]